MKRVWGLRECLQEIQLDNESSERLKRLFKLIFGALSESMPDFLIEFLASGREESLGFTGMFARDSVG